MKRRSFIAALLAVLLAGTLFAAAIPARGLADAGNFSGDSDYGGSSDSGWSSSDSSWDSSSGGALIDSDGGGMVFAVIAAAVIIYFIFKGKNGKGGGTGGSGGSGRMSQRQIDNGLDQLKQQDPEFSKEELLERVGNMYVQLQDAWEAKKWEPIRVMMTDSLFNQFNRQLQEYVEKNQTNHVDRIAVLSSEIVSFSQDEVNDIMKVLLKTRIVDYVTNDADGSLVSGDKNREKFMTYEWTLIRAKGVTSHHEKGASRVSCPSCGAPMNINQSGKCEYCSTVLTTGTYDWIISAIRGISQVTK
jgi:hypothetical protein